MCLCMRTSIRNYLISRGVVNIFSMYAQSTAATPYAVMEVGGEERAYGMKGKEEDKSIDVTFQLSGNNLSDIDTLGNDIIDALESIDVTAQNGYVLIRAFYKGSSDSFMLHHSREIPQYLQTLNFSVWLRSV